VFKLCESGHGGPYGVFEAVVKAVETVDACAEAVVKAGLAHGYSFVIIADHGNADVMMNEDEFRIQHIQRIWFLAFW
jgi:bisphosphoglycerate-independent phosphoglycerate mutase (AlkP superfamily)